MNERTSRVGVSVCVIILAAGVWLANAGSLDPPDGPIAPTMKTLTVVEPRTPVQSLSGDSTAWYVIDQPGSYYLTGDINGVAGKSGIRISTGEVTLDLNGFTVRGTTDTLDGIDAGGQYHIVIRNGVIMGWRNWAISNTGPFCRIEDVIANANEGGGISAGSHALIARCIAVNSGAITGSGHGISAGQGSIIKDCITDSNQGSGLSVGNGSIVTNVVAAGHTASGRAGVCCGSGCVVSDCVASANYKGIEVSVGSTVENAVVSDNTRGILGDVGITVHSCTITDTDNCGVEAFDSLIRGNTFGNPNGTDICGTGNTAIENQMTP